MKVAYVRPDDLTISPELARSRSSKVFEERLKASIQEMGLAEPLKVSSLRGRKHLVIDGILRLKAIRAIRTDDPTQFEAVPVYLVDHRQRFEIRYQTDIYQDLLPSQLATLVEHLHRAENIKKADIARYIGVSPATLRNYTGLWRLMERGGLFSKVVELMDLGVFPASNPYAWLRLTDDGLRYALATRFAGGGSAADWVEQRIEAAKRGDVAPYPLKDIEAKTDELTDDCYRLDAEFRERKRDFGLLRAATSKPKVPRIDTRAAIAWLNRVSHESSDEVLAIAAAGLSDFLQ